MNNRNTIAHILSAMCLGMPITGHAFLGGLFVTNATGEEQQAEAIEMEASLFVQNKHPALRPFFYSLWSEGERNAVLNLNYLGLAAMETRQVDVAKAAFDESITRIEAIYANDANAEKAKSLWSEESVKDFKGEPHERSMTYYYRGLLYAMDGDYQNARASFLSADRHDTLSEQELYQGDFGLMNYLAAWASYCDGDDSRASELGSRAIKQDHSHFSELGYTHPYLLLIDAGTGPKKTGAGQYNEILTITPSNTKSDIITSIETSSPGKFSKLFDVGSVTYQATTRGGRPFQGILNGKALFKENADTFGTAAIDIGNTALMTGAYSGNSDSMRAGSIISIIGAISKIAAASATPTADTRAWNSLPDKVVLAYSDAVPTTAPIHKISYSAGSGIKTTASHLHSIHGKCSLSWGRTRSALIDLDERGAILSRKPEIHEDRRGTKNKAFRAMLVDRFSQGDQSKVDIMPASKTPANSAATSALNIFGDI